jgi:hypothetical protein
MAQAAPRRGRAVLVTLVLAAAGLAAAQANPAVAAPPRSEAAASPAAGSVPGAFRPLPGGRVAKVRVRPGRTVLVEVAGRAGVPAGRADAVALNAVAAARDSAAGSVTVYAAGSRRPGVPSLAWARHAAAAGPLITALGTAGQVDVRDDSVWTVTITLDAAGYWLAGTPAAAGTFVALPGARVIRVRIGADRRTMVPVAGRAGVPAAGTGGVALNAVAAARDGAAGQVTVFPAGSSGPGLASLAWGQHQSATGLVLAALGTAGQVEVRNFSGSAVTITFDAAGYWLAGAAAAAGAFLPVGGAAIADPVTVKAGQTALVQVAGRGGIPTSGAGAVALNALAMVPGGATGSVTVYAAGSPAPGQPSLAWARHEYANNLLITALGGTGQIEVRNDTARTVTIFLGATGYWLTTPARNR